MRIEGRTAIITGASSGIGRETARELAGRGANIILAARHRQRLEAVAADIAPLRGRCLVVPTDVTDRLATEALVRRTMEEFGGVDILVNNAGVGLFAPIAGGSLENARRLFDVNFWGAIHCIQAVVPYMRSQRRGHIVNVSSVAGRIAPPYMGIYSATKFALTAVSDALRNELAGSSIGVSTVFPGLTESSFQDNMLREVDVPTIPPAARLVTASAAAVARRIAQAIRWNLRDVYVSPGDLAAVGLNAVAPYVVDWGMRALWLGLGPRERPEPSPPAPASTPPEPSPANAEPPAESA